MDINVDAALAHLKEAGRAGSSIDARSGDAQDAQVVQAAQQWQEPRDVNVATASNIQLLQVQLIAQPAERVDADACIDQVERLAKTVGSSETLIDRVAVGNTATAGPGLEGNQSNLSV